MTDFRRLLGEVNVPSNILRLVTTWGTPKDKDKIVASFVAYVEGIADKAPLDRMFAFVGSGFRLLGSSGSPELRQRFVAALLPWLLEHWAVRKRNRARSPSTCLASVRAACSMTTTS